MVVLVVVVEVVVFQIPLLSEDLAHRDKDLLVVMVLREVVLVPVVAVVHLKLVVMGSQLPVVDMVAKVVMA